ncbi:hypothetical protein SNE40_002142 [Patella caerulea]|uniref:Peptidase metallopeptidase domain-containing protein n=1 Tax=Patella caerulea TaxID=87958 RepID=A0AAN8K0J8_PATCE
MWRLLSALCMISVAYGASLGEALLGRDSFPIRSADELFDSAEFLEKYGYLRSTDKQGVSHSEFEILQSIRDFQKFNGLVETGFLDQDTLDKMKAPRCGFPDIIRNTSKLFDPNSPLSFTTLGTKWNKNVITWKPVSYTRQLSGSEQLAAIQKALDHWAEVTPLEFKYTQGVADIEIKFAYGEHGDGAFNGFDGRGGVLAHAFRPGDQPLNGDAHFDEGEKWTLQGDDGSNLEIVAAHEFGHALGLGHSQINPALMAPYYKYSPKLKLEYDDIRAIQFLYGANPRVRTNPPTTTQPTTTTPRGERPDYCDMKMDAIDLGPDGAVYGYRRNKIYKMNENGLVSGFPKLITSVFPGAPSRIRAVTYSPSARQTYMFKGSMLWRYTYFKLDAGYPKIIDMTNFPEKPHAAMWYSDNYIQNALFLFGHRYFWQWDPQREIIVRTMNINQFWTGVPDSLEAAFKHSDGYIYFFKGLKYRKFNPNKRYVEDGYPKTYSAAWFKNRCGNEPR